MKSYWIYGCDWGHHWRLLRDFNAAEDPKDAVCPHGHQAVMLLKRPLVNPVQISIRSACCLADHPITSKVVGKDRYYLVLSDLNSDEEHMSGNAYLWEEVKEACDLVRDLPMAQAIKALENAEG